MDSPAPPILDPGGVGPLPGYAPKLCLAGPSHHARRDTAITDRIVWRCVSCGRGWTTSGEEIP